MKRVFYFVIHILLQGDDGSFDEKTWKKKMNLRRENNHNEPLFLVSFASEMNQR